MVDQYDMFDGEGAFLIKLRSMWAKGIEGDGGFCPCCGKWGKIAKFKLRQYYALSLRWIAINGEEDGWVNVQAKGPKFIMRSKNYAQLKHWGLIESKENKSGIWRVTQRGLDFMNGITTMPIAVYTYNKQIFGFDNEQTSYRGLFGVHFDYDEMMSARFDWASIKGRDDE
jgi:hypothetical protein